jgi:hypothetical protein
MRRKDWWSKEERLAEEGGKSDVNRGKAGGGKKKRWLRKEGRLEDNKTRMEEEG